MRRKTCPGCRAPFEKTNLKGVFLCSRTCGLARQNALNWVYKNFIEDKNLMLVWDFSNWPIQMCWLSSKDGVEPQLFDNWLAYDVTFEQIKILLTFS